MTVMLAVVAACCFAGAGFVVVEELSRSRRELRRSFARAGSYGRADAERAAADESVVVAAPHALQRLSARSARIALALMPGTAVDDVQFRLARAGVAGRLSATDFLALKLSFSGGGAAFGILFGFAAGGLAAALFLVFVLTLGCFLLPDWLVQLRIRARRETIRATLPNALDLLAVTVEAGLGLPAAIARLTETTAGPLSDEFALALGQMSIGESRADALRRMADRVAVPELSSFVRAVVQADQLGVALGRTLRLQASETRARRQLAAEERAQKAPIKMLIPTALFIFPTLFIVALGPAVLSIMKLLG